ncbi:MAG: hypothetical protein RIM84_19465 [Alphaproteobacteria bacterium]
MENSSTSYIDWPAIIAGAILASAIAFVLGSFGTAVGLSLVSPLQGEGVPPTLALIAVAIWMIWVATSSFMCGAYLAGRMRRRVPDATEHEVDVRDGTHGLLVWALGAIMGALLLSGTATTTANVGAKVVGSAAGAAVAAGGAAAAASADDLSSSYTLDRLFRTPADAVDVPPAEDLDRSAAEAVRILVQNIDEEQLPAEDRQYLASMIARNTGLGEEEAMARVDAAFAEVREARESTLEAAEAARKVSVIAAFVVAASLLIGAAGAYWAGGLGGRHRDKQTVFALFTIR